MTIKILYDSHAEGIWFASLHPALAGALLAPFPGTPTGDVERVLAYDRPDIILLDDNRPILVLERTEEVPSGHNVGQRFGRLIAAARAGVPTVYFGPYAAYKHGGATAGPRYMNLRLFRALRAMADVESAAITTINWPVDGRFELIRGTAKDVRMRAYLDTFFTIYPAPLPKLNERIKKSQFEREQAVERDNFILTVARRTVYDSPPGTVDILETASLSLPPHVALALTLPQTVRYRVGMTYMRSDPYTGTALMYAYLYCGGMDARTRNLLLVFPQLTVDQWRAASSATRTGKTVRLYRLAADAIEFSDGWLAKSEL
jgi:hypothetical protein